MFRVHAVLQVQVQNMFASRFLATFETQAGLEERGLIPGTPCLSRIPTLGPNAYE